MDNSEETTVCEELNEGYEAMGNDPDRERDANEWCEGFVTDATLP